MHSIDYFSLQLNIGTCPWPADAEEMNGAKGCCVTELVDQKELRAPLSKRKKRIVEKRSGEGIKKKKNDQLACCCKGIYV